MPDLETTLELESPQDDLASLVQHCKQALNQLNAYYEWGVNESVRQDRLRNAIAILKRAVKEYGE